MRVLKSNVRMKRRVSRQNFKSHERCAGRMKPFLLWFKLCGMFANKIADGQLKRCSTPFYGICVFWLSVYVSYSCFLLNNYLKADIQIRMLLDLIKHLVGFISLSVNVIVAYSSQNYFCQLFDRLDSYDEEAARMKSERKDNLWIPRIAMLLATAINLFFISVLMQKKSTDTEYYKVIADVCTVPMHIYSTLQKFLLLYLILVRFKHLNEKIVPKISWSKKRREPNTIEIMNVQIMHSMLYDAQQAFSVIYRFPLLLWFANLMIRVLVNIRIFQTETALIACNLVIFPCMQMLILCTICHYTAEEANKINCIINKGMTALVNSGQTMKKIEFLTYLMDTRVSFDAAGYFTINLPLFQSIIATVTTYFMILI